MSATGSDGRESRAAWAAEVAEERAQALAAGVSEAAARAGQGAEEAVRSTGRQLETASVQLREQSHAAAAAAGERLDRAGAPDAVRQPVQATVQAAAGAAESLADRMELGGAYLEEQGVAGLFEDLAGVGRRHPGPILGSILAAVTLLALLVLLRLRRSG